MDLRRITRRLTIEDTEQAYREGLFPMSEPRVGIITWHQPEPRAILPLDRFHTSRSLARTLRSGKFEVTFDTNFEGVMRACAEREPGEHSGTWINEEFIQVYGELYRRGKAHSVEVWVNGLLAGGLYGVHLGAAFFAESKFHRVTDMSKVALAKLVERLRERDFKLLEVQYLTDHLAQFGVMEIPDHRYQRLLREALAVERSF